MAYDINTLDDLLEALDGPTQASRTFGDTSARGVCNWKYRGFLPPSRHLQTVIELRRRGLTINPELLDHTEEDWRVLGLQADSAA